MHDQLHEIAIRQQQENFLRDSQHLLSASRSGQRGGGNSLTTRLRAALGYVTHRRFGSARPRPAVQGTGLVGASQEPQIRPVLSIDPTVELTDGLVAVAPSLPRLESSASSSDAGSADSVRHEPMVGVGSEDSTRASGRTGRRRLPNRHGNGSRHGRTRHTSASGSSSRRAR